MCYMIRIMVTRTRIILLFLAFIWAGHAAGAKRIAPGDSLSEVSRQYGSPEVEYPLNGTLVQEYELCTIVSSNNVVLSAEYTEAAQAAEELDGEKKPPTIQEIKAKALEGDAESQYLLAYCFQFGKAIEQNNAQAIVWYKRSAMQGYVSSQHNLGYLYMVGRGVEQDYVQAYTWALLAAENGNDTLMKSLLYKLTPEQQLAGAQRAEQLRLLIETQEADVKH